MYQTGQKNKLESLKECKVIRRVLEQVILSKRNNGVLDAFSEDYLNQYLDIQYMFIHVASALFNGEKLTLAQKFDTLKAIKV